MEPDRSLSLDEIDLSSPEFWVAPTEVREGAFATLRAGRPVARMEEFDSGILPKGPGYWAITRHADILEASRTPQVYCSGRGSQIADMPESFNEFFGSMINTDDPRHGRLRRIVSRGFTPRALGRLEQDVQRRAEAIVDRVMEKGECDFVTEIAAPLPLEITCAEKQQLASKSKLLFITIQANAFTWQ